VSDVVTTKVVEGAAVNVEGVEVEMGEAVVLRIDVPTIGRGWCDGSPCERRELVGRRRNNQRSGGQGHEHRED